MPNKRSKIEIGSDSAAGFGYKCGWFATPTVSTDLLPQAFGLLKPKPIDWLSGITAAYDDKVFVTPSIRGWTLLPSWTWLSFLDHDPANEVGPTIRAVSKQLGQLQFFVTYRVPEYHLWVQSHEGQIHRAYCWMGEIGEILWDEGEPTSIEKQIGPFDAETWPREHSVMEIAESWSVNPSTLEDTFKEPSEGLLCDPPKMLPT